MFTALTLARPVAYPLPARSFLPVVMPVFTATPVVGQMSHGGQHSKIVDHFLQHTEDPPLHAASWFISHSHRLALSRYNNSG